MLFTMNAYGVFVAKNGVLPEKVYMRALPVLTTSDEPPNHESWKLPYAFGPVIVAISGKVNRMAFAEKFFATLKVLENVEPFHSPSWSAES